MTGAFDLDSWTWIKVGALLAILGSGIAKSEAVPHSSQPYRDERDRTKLKAVVCELRTAN